MPWVVVVMVQNKRTRGEKRFVGGVFYVSLGMVDGGGGGEIKGEISSIRLSASKGVSPGLQVRSHRQHTRSVNVIKIDTQG